MRHRVKEVDVEVVEVAQGERKKIVSILDKPELKIYLNTAHMFCFAKVKKNDITYLQCAEHLDGNRTREKRL